MKLTEKFNLQPGFDKTAMEKTAMDKIAAYSGDVAMTLVAYESDKEQLLKTAAADYNEMSDMDKIAAENLMSYGQGYYYGEQMGKQAAFDAAHDHVFEQVLYKLAEYAGPEAAADFYTWLKKASGEEINPEEEQAIQQIHDTARDAATEVLVQQAGGEEAVQADPELKADIIDKANQTAAIVVEQVLAGAETDEEVPPAPAGHVAPAPTV